MNKKIQISLAGDWKFAGSEKFQPSTSVPSLLLQGMFK